MSVSFDQPYALFLLALLLLAAAIHWKTQAYLTTRRLWLSLGLRLLVITLLVLAIAAPRVQGRADSVAVVYLLDQSQSVSADQRQYELDFVRQSMAQAGPRDTSAVVVFGGNALVEAPLGAHRDLPAITSTPDRSHTDIQAAMKLGMALFPSTSAKRLVLMTDGNENLGHAQDQLRVLAAAGVSLDVVPLRSAQGAEAYVKQVESPSVVREGEGFNVTATVISNDDLPGRIQLFTDGRLAVDEAITIRRGANSYVLGHKPLGKGFHAFHVLLSPQRSMMLENKEGDAFSVVLGPPHLLMVEGEAGEGQNLASAMRSAGLQVDVRAPSGLPSNLATLRGWDSLVLVNVPASRLSPTQQKSIKTYVQEFGGGLVIVGGERSYSIGGYAKTPIEDVMPVTTQVSPRRNIPSSAVVYIIESLESNLGVDISKEAAKASIAALSPLDQVAVSDANSGWYIPLTRVTDKQELMQKIDSMDPGDPSSYRPFLEQAHEVLKHTDAKVKHIILLGDGDATENYEALVKSIAADKITLSVVGTNVAPSDLQLLQNLAEWGKGRYYDGNDPFDIPQLLIRETQLVAKPAIIEEPIRPQVDPSNPMLADVAVNTLPDLKGYIATTAKPTAQVVMRSPEDDPILAEWQYGLGHVVAWMSDAKGKWATDWLRWGDFNRFWSQVAKRTLPAQVDQNLQATVNVDGQTAHLVVDAVGANHEFRNFATTTAVVESPKQEKHDVTLAQTAPGRYEGAFPAGEQGSYLIELVQKDQDGSLAGTQLKGFVVPYSPEYQEFSPNTELLNNLVAQGNGRLLTAAQQVFEHNLPAVGGARAVWPWLAALGLALFLVDVAARRLRVSLVDLRHAWQRWGAPWLTPLRPIATPVSTRLLQAKQRTAVGEAGAAQGLRLARLSQRRIERAEPPAIPRLVQEPTTAMAAERPRQARLLEAKRRAEKRLRSSGLD